MEMRSNGDPIDGEDVDVDAIGDEAARSYSAPLFPSPPQPFLHCSNPSIIDDLFSCTAAGVRQNEVMALGD
jgi:hypothetical protein